MKRERDKDFSDNNYIKSKIRLAVDLSSKDNVYVLTNYALRIYFQLKRRIQAVVNNTDERSAFNGN
jgi:hypothetical protein